MNKINLLFLNYSFDIGGIETLLLTMCRNLDQRRYSAAVCSFKRTAAMESEFSNAGIPYYSLTKKEGIDFTLPWRLRRLLKERSIHILHTHNAAQWLYGVLACQGLSRPRLIHTQHSVLEKCEWKLSYIYKLLSMPTKHVVAVAPAVAEYLVKRTGISAAKTKVIYNGIDTASFAKALDAREISRAVGITNGDFVVGIIARLVPVKDHRNLLNAMALVRQKNTRARLLVVGDGPLEGELRQQALACGIMDHVNFLGARRDIGALLQIMNVFVLPSRSEGFSVTLLEAMAAGVPVIASDVGGNSEIIKHETTGLLIPPGDPELLARGIISLMENQAHALEIAARAKRHVTEHFSIEKMLARYQELYESSQH